MLCPTKIHDSYHAEAERLNRTRDNQQKWALVMVKIKFVLVDYLVPCFRCRNDWVLMESNPSFLIDDDGDGSSYQSLAVEQK